MTWFQSDFEFDISSCGEWQFRVVKYNIYKKWAFSTGIYQAPNGFSVNICPCYHLWFWNSYPRFHIIYLFVLLCFVFCCFSQPMRTAFICCITGADFRGCVSVSLASATGETHSMRHQCYLNAKHGAQGADFSTFACLHISDSLTRLLWYALSARKENNEPKKKNNKR